MKRTLLCICISLLLTACLFTSLIAAVDTRLQMVSNTGGELVFNVQAQSLSGDQTVTNFNHSVSFDGDLTAEYESHSYSNRLFSTINGETPYVEGVGRSELIYAYSESGGLTIGTEWVTVVTITVNYTIADKLGSVLWGPNALEVYNGAEDVTGTAGATLTDFSLPIELSSFTAMFTPGIGVTLTWRTESEVECEGFHIWRKDATEVNFSRITSTIIPGHGNSPTPHDYTYEDKNTLDGQAYSYKLEEIATNGLSTFYGPFDAEVVELPVSFTLFQNYPNPFNPITEIKYDLTDQTNVRLSIFNALGQEIKILVNENQSPGTYSVLWDGLGNQNQPQGSGIYYYKLIVDEEILLKKMIKLK